MTTVCCKCQVEMRVKRNGVVAVVMAEYGPIELRRGDKWWCPECGHDLLIGFAEKPELSAFDTAFQARLDSYDLDPTETVVRYWLNARERAAHDFPLAKTS